MDRTQPSDLHAHPRLIAAEAVEEFGLESLVHTCLALLDGSIDYQQLPVPLTYLAGVHAVTKLGRGDLVLRRQDHWPRVWAARSLRYQWLAHAEPGVVAALGDRAWRVREMAAKVVGDRVLSSAVGPLQSLLHDVQPRVRVAGVRAMGAVGAREHLRLVAAMDVTDPALQVAVAAATRRLRLSTQLPAAVGEVSRARRRRATARSS